MRGQIAFIFPGTSVQARLEASCLATHAGTARLVKTAEAVLGYPLGQYMTQGAMAELRRPRHALPATFLSSLAVFYALIEEGVRPAVLLGYSLGGVTAAVASGSVAFETGLRMAQTNGELFERACAATPSGMSVIMGLTFTEVQRLCERAQRMTGGVCEVACMNTAGNFVISGTAAAIDNAAQLARRQGASTMPLPLAVACHSSLMKDSEKEFVRTLRESDFQDAVFPIVSEYADAVITSGKAVFQLIATETSRRVNWVKRIGLLNGANISRFIELGPNLGLAAMSAQLLAGTAAQNIESCADIRSLLACDGLQATS